MRKAGYRVVYQPLSKVIHFEGVSNGTDVQGSGLKRYQVVNNKKLREKWAAELACQCENNGNPDPFRARERSMGKKIILVVDHYVPTYDRDAGSKTTFQYLKMFLKKGYVVKFLGDNFLHEEPYSTTLQQMGIEILYGPEYQVGIWDWLKDHGDDIAIAYLNRPHIASKYIDFIKENTNIKVIYYGHDLHFLREGREFALTGDPALKQSSEYWKAVETSLMYKAAMSYYPSYIERDAIKAEDEEIPVKDIVAYVYDEFKDKIPTDFEKREGILFVGGFAHPPNADAVLWFVREVYPLLRSDMEAKGQKAPDFYVVGSKVTDEIKALEQPGNGVIIKGFVSEEELAELYVHVRIRLIVGSLGAVTLRVRHGAVHHQVLVLDVGQELLEVLMIMRAVLLVHFVRGGEHRVERVHTHAPLEAAGRLLAQQTLHLHLVHQVLGGLMQMGKTVYFFTGQIGGNSHQICVFGILSQLISHGHAVDRGADHGVIHPVFNLLAKRVHAGVQFP